MKKFKQKKMIRKFVRPGFTVLNNCKRYSTKLHPDFEYCMNLVKTTDSEAYLTTLLSPPEIMRASFAVKALNIELLSIGRSIKEPRIPQLKVQFWKEQIDKIFNTGGQEETRELNPQEFAIMSRNSRLSEPISKEIALSVKQFKLNKIWFNRVIEGRKSFINNQQIGTIEDLEKCADTNNIYYILFNCMNLKNVDCDHAASHVGKAELLCGVAKNLIKKSTQSVYYLPTDLLIKHKISQQDLFNSSERILRSKQQNLKDLAFDLCTRANEHLKSARSLRSKVPVEARPILVSAVGCEIFLGKMEKYDFDLMNPKLNSNFRNTLILKLLIAKLKKSF